MYIHVIFVLFKVKELPDEEKFSVIDSVSYFSKLFYCLKTNSKYLKSDESFENWHNTVRDFFEYLNNSVGRYFGEPGQSIRTRLSKTSTIQSGDILENRDNRFERDFREPGQTSLTRFSRSGTIQSDEIFEIRKNSRCKRNTIHLQR